MRLPSILLAFFTLALTFPAFSQEGKVMYEQLCGACHGNDGQGAQEGQFPRLADSAWIKGAPDRMVQIVLHGLMGEITVPSEHAANPTYNLDMTPQGAALTDEQIARITSYVRSAWGNKEIPVTVAMVAAQREATKVRFTFWQADDILDKYPLKVVDTPEDSLADDGSLFVGANRKSVRLVVKNLQAGHVHHLRSNGVRSRSGGELWHKDAYYTINEFPK